MEPRSFLFDPPAHPRNMLFLGNTDYLFRGERSPVRLEESSKRKPFSCSPEEMLGDEYYDEQSPEKKRRLSSEQVYLLEKTFEVESKLEPETKAELAKKLGLRPRQVAIWFQNRRARWRNKQIERDYDRLKSSYDSLLADYDSILKDNEKLRLEVTSLNEELQSRGSYPSQGHGVDPAKDKVDDGLSSGSGGSAVVDGDVPWFVDSPGWSYYYLRDDQHVGLVDMVELEEYNSSGGDDQGCFCGVFSEQEVPASWWDWP